MANKDSWNEIAGYSWKELTDEGYTTWKSLYYVALAAVGTITFAFDSFAKRAVSLASTGAISSAFTSSISRLRKALATGAISLTITGTFKRYRTIVATGAIQFVVTARLSARWAVSSTMDICIGMLSNLRHIWDSINPVTIDWTEATKGSSEWTETNMDESTNSSSTWSES